MFVEQTCFFQEGLYYVLRTDTNFPGGFIELTRFFLKEGLSVCRTDLYYLIEQIFKHILFSRRPLCLEQIGISQERIPHRIRDISLIGLGGCFRKNYVQCLLFFIESFGRKSLTVLGRNK